MAVSAIAIFIGDANPSSISLPLRRGTVNQVSGSAAFAALAVIFFVRRIEDDFDGEDLVGSGDGTDYGSAEGNANQGTG
jgi:hypothetical protein